MSPLQILQQARTHQKVTKNPPNLTNWRASGRDMLAYHRLRRASESFVPRIERQLGTLRAPFRLVRLPGCPDVLGSLS